MKLIPIFLLLFPVLSFSQETHKITAAYYKIEGSNIGVFPEDMGELRFTYSRFTPTKEEVEKAECAIIENPELLNKSGNKYDPVIYKNLRNYNRQYFGYINEKGDRILLINAFWNEFNPFENWLDERIEMLDGGSYYWNIKYNSSTRQLFDLSINGNA